MTQAITLDPNDEAQHLAITPALASGLFGYSIFNDRLQTNKPLAGYIRDIEQMPNFAPPSMEVFVAQYVAANIERAESSS